MYCHNMPVFVSTTFMPNQSSVIDAVRLLKENNIFNIELGSIHRYEKGLDSLLKNVRCNYITHNFFPPSEERLILNIASTDEGVRRRSLDFIKSAIDFSEKINAGIYTVHPGFLVDPIRENSSPKNYDFRFSSVSEITSLPMYSECVGIFLDSLNEMADYARDKLVTIAVETQGSVTKKGFVFFSKPEDFSIFLKECRYERVGINLNLAHLSLAANAWGFNKYEVVEMLKSRIVAVEVSHNDGIDDGHRALKVGGWYMELLEDDVFKNIPVIFEGRNLQIEEVLQSYALLSDILE